MGWGVWHGKPPPQPANRTVRWTVGEGRFCQNAESYGCRAWRVHDEQSLLAALEASRVHSGPVLLDIKVLPKTMTHDYASWWRTGDAQVADSPSVRKAAEQTFEQVKKPVSTKSD
jgi:TPP-dependent trihydroxycyclohexane-1,2-dione (THcHDO) dehydratase